MAFAGWCSFSHDHVPSPAPQMSLQGAVRWEGRGAALAATDEPFDEGAPGDCFFRHAETGLVCVADARPASAAGIASLYLRHGLDFPRHLDGVFAAALWDPRAFRLILLADRAATRSVIYAATANGIFFATELDAVTHHVPAEIDLAALLARCSSGLPLRALALRGLCRMLPGEITVYEKGQIRHSRYWEAADAPDIRFARPGEYIEAAEAVWDAAVKDSLPRQMSVATQLSGGLDSTLVTGAAARLLAPEGRRLSAFTSTHTDPGIPGLWQGAYWDEHAAAGAFAARFANIDHTCVPSDGAALMPALDAMWQSRAMPSVAPFALTIARTALAQAARGSGAKVMLVGTGGNQTLSQGLAHYLWPLLCRGHWVRAWRSAGALMAKGTSPRHVARQIVTAMLPDMVTDRLRRLAGHHAPNVLGIVPFTAAVRNDRSVREAIARAACAINREAFAPRPVTAQFARFGGDSYNAWYRHGFGMDVRAPFMDRHVIEFCAGLPPDLFLTGGEERALARLLLRRMGAPEALAAERRRGVQYAHWHAVLLKNRKAILAELDAAETTPSVRDVIDIAALRRLAESLPGADPRARRDFAGVGITLPAGVSLARFLRLAPQYRFSPPTRSEPA